MFCVELWHKGQTSTFASITKVQRLVPGNLFPITLFVKVKILKIEHNVLIIA